LLEEGETSDSAVTQVVPVLGSLVEG
jgi:hypothetical protein